MKERPKQNVTVESILASIKHSQPEDPNYCRAEKLGHLQAVCSHLLNIVYADTEHWKDVLVRTLEDMYGIDKEKK